MSVCNNCGRLDCPGCNSYTFSQLTAETIKAGSIVFRPVFPQEAPEPMCETTAGSVPAGAMVERIARAIAFKMQGTCDKPEDERTWEDYAKAARFALAQLREPTANMCQAALETSVRENKGIEYSPYQGWQAMIDEALK